MFPTFCQYLAFQTVGFLAGILWSGGRVILFGKYFNLKNILSKYFNLKHVTEIAEFFFLIGAEREITLKTGHQKDFLPPKS